VLAANNSMDYIFPLYLFYVLTELDAVIVKYRQKVHINVNIYISLNSEFHTQIKQKTQIK